jgi:hypothetical protein
MSQFVEELRTTLSGAFESDEYRARRQVIEEEIKERQEKAFEEIQAQAKEHSMALLRTPGGLVFAPVRDGEVLPPEEFETTRMCARVWGKCITQSQLRNADGSHLAAKSVA